MLAREANDFYVVHVDRETLDFYACNASRLAEHYASVEASPLAPLIEGLEGCRRVLDVGCGTGRDLAILLEAGFDAYGADPSPEMIAQAERQIEIRGYSPNRRLIEAGLPGLEPFDSEEFDAVFCNAVLMHIPEESIFDAVYGLRRIL